MHLHLTLVLISQATSTLEHSCRLQTSSSKRTISPLCSRFPSTRLTWTWRAPFHFPESDDFRFDVDLGNGHGCGGWRWWGVCDDAIPLTAFEPQGRLGNGHRQGLEELWSRASMHSTSFPPPTSASRISKWKWSCELGIMRNKVSFDM